MPNISDLNAAAQRLASAPSEERLHIAAELFTASVRQRGTIRPRGSPTEASNGQASQAGIQTHLLACLGEGDTKTLRKIILALGELGDGTIIEKLAGILRSIRPKPEEVRLASVTALGKIGGPAAVSALAVAALRDDSEEVRVSALEAISELCVGGWADITDRYSPSATPVSLDDIERCIANAPALAEPIRTLAHVQNLKDRAQEFKEKAIESLALLVSICRQPKINIDTPASVAGQQNPSLQQGASESDHAVVSVQGNGASKLALDKAKFGTLEGRIPQCELIVVVADFIQDPVEIGALLASVKSNISKGVRYLFLVSRGKRETSNAALAHFETIANIAIQHELRASNRQSYEIVFLAELPFVWEFFPYVFYFHRQEHPAPGTAAPRFEVVGLRGNKTHCGIADLYAPVAPEEAYSLATLFMNYAPSHMKLQLAIKTDSASYKREWQEDSKIIEGIFSHVA